MLRLSQSGSAVWPDFLFSGLASGFPAARAAQLRVASLRHPFPHRHHHRCPLLPIR